jgi:hypothetical protein
MSEDMSDLLMASAKVLIKAGVKHCSRGKEEPSIITGRRLILKMEP